MPDRLRTASFPGDWRFLRREVSMDYSMVMPRRGMHESDAEVVSHGR
jgi:hypothetical protein